MSKQLSKGQASRSSVHDSMPNVYGTQTKESQRPVMSNSQPGSTSHQEETLDARAKRKVPAAHVGPHNRPGEERDSLNEAQIKRIDRSHPGDAKESVGAAARARREHHGKSTNADGTSFAEPGKQVARLV